MPFRRLQFESFKSHSCGWQSARAWATRRLMNHWFFFFPSFNNFILLWLINIQRIASVLLTPYLNSICKLGYRCSNQLRLMSVWWHLGTGDPSAKPAFCYLQYCGSCIWTWELTQSLASLWRIMLSIPKEIFIHFQSPFKFYCNQFWSCQKVENNQSLYC